MRTRVYEIFQYDIQRTAICSDFQIVYRYSIHLFFLANSSHPLIERDKSHRNIEESSTNRMVEIDRLYRRIIEFIGYKFSFDWNKRNTCIAYYCVQRVHLISNFNYEFQLKYFNSMYGQTQYPVTKLLSLSHDVAFTSPPSSINHHKSLWDRKQSRDHNVASTKKRKRDAIQNHRYVSAEMQHYQVSRDNMASCWRHLVVPEKRRRGRIHADK